MAASGFRGVYPMIYALFGSGALDRAAMRRQVEHCVACGAHGVAALGLGTEVSKLTPDERRGNGLGGRGPAGPPAARDHRVRRDAGRADRVRPGRRRARRRLGDPAAAAPPKMWPEPITEDQLVDFFGAVADASPLPVAIQNAPQYIGVGLSSLGSTG